MKRSITAAKKWVRGTVHNNEIESMWALLKRSITGTWHHVSFKHLHRYVSEASVRLDDEGNCGVDANGQPSRSPK